MAPPVNFPSQGPDQTVFMVMFGLGFLVALLGYLTGSRTLRLAGIVLLFAATGVLLVDVFTTSASGAATVSSISHLAGALALAGVEGGEE
jgi:hypothetical protein